MPIKRLNPYLNFNGNAEQAIRHYERALGAKVESLMRWGDMPGGEVPEASKNRVMHSVLRVGDFVFMAADGPPGVKVEKGNVHVILDFDDPVEMGRTFEALAEGGNVTHAIRQEFWGGHFGTLDDAYGVSWMFHCEVKK